MHVFLYCPRSVVWFFVVITLLMKRRLVALLYLCCGRLCSVPCPHGAVVESAVCDFGISWSYLLP